MNNSDPSIPPVDFSDAASAPTDVPSMLKRAVQMMKEGNNDEAKKLVASALQVNKLDADAWYLYACLIESKEKKIAALQRVLSLNPNHPRAQQMLDSLRTVDDIFNDLMPAPTSTPVHQPAPAPLYQQPAPVAQQPIVYVNVNQANNNQQQVNVNATPVAVVNNVALVIGFIAAGFFGIFGLGHLFNGKIGGALMNFLGGIFWLIAAGLLIGVSAGICLFGVVPLHFYLAWMTSKKGATTP